MKLLSSARFGLPACVACSYCLLVLPACIACLCCLLVLPAYLACLCCLLRTQTTAGEVSSGAVIVNWFPSPARRMAKRSHSPKTVLASNYFYSRLRLFNFSIESMSLNASSGKLDLSFALDRSGRGGGGERGVWKVLSKVSDFKSKFFLSWRQME